MFILQVYYTLNPTPIMSLEAFAEGVGIDVPTEEDTSLHANAVKQFTKPLLLPYYSHYAHARTR